MFLENVDIYWTENQMSIKKKKERSEKRGFFLIQEFKVPLQILRIIL